MRLAAQVKGGFYPAPPQAIEHVASHLTLAPLPEKGGVHVLLDPCCGKGAAVRQLADQVGIPHAQVLAVELDAKRAAEAQAHIPEAKVLAETDFLATALTRASVSLAWVNPPFDDELGGGNRVEYKFLGEATRALCKKGVLALCCPERVVGRTEVRSLLMSWYERLAVVPFPAEHRPFNEVVVFGVKRMLGADGSRLHWHNECPDRTNALGQYEVPPVGGLPKRFEKSGFTDVELALALANSRSRRVLAPPPALLVPKPGLQLTHGQRALVLAGGFLNRVLQKDGAEPIVIKASPFKEDYLKGQDEEEDEATGKKRTVTVYSQKICLRVRVLDTGGLIHDLK